jgi:CheY-like chemotaxis protein
VETLRSLDDAVPGGPYDLMLLDLQTVPGDPAVVVTRVRGLIEAQRAASGKDARLIAFGPHVAKERLSQAQAAGADAVVSRGELLGGFATLVNRWLAQ